MRSLGTASWLRTITFLLAVALLGSIASAVSAQPSQPFQGDAPTDPGSVVADRAALIQIQGRDDLDEPITPPMAPAYIDWYWGSDQEQFRELITDFTIHNDVGDWSDTHGYYLILLHNHISDKGVYFGLQTDANRRGKAVIFSRWGTLDLANARWDETNGWTESAGHEGDFIGVRRSYNWGVGDYRIRFAPDSNYSATDGAWFGLWITDLSTTTETWVGSLKFPLKNGTTTLDRVHASATIELYGNPPIRPIDIPFWHVSVKRPLGDGVLATRGRTRYPYDDSDNALPNSDVQYASSEGAAHLRLGGMTERTNVGETIDVLSPCANGIAVPDAASNPGLVADCDSLLSARDTLAGTATLDWSADLAVWNWDGVTVSGTPPRVTSLNLQFRQLTGTIPAELGDLTNLQTVELHVNQLSGEIPGELGSLTNLEILWLGHNQLSGEIPSELGGLTNLRTVELHVNQISGEIPSELGSLTNLTWLVLNGNQISGEIPSELGGLTNLTHLYLSENQLSGEIPEELGSLPNLTYLNLRSNQLTGPIPAQLGSLTNLTHLYLWDNELSGKIPAQLGNLTNLETLGLSLNQLSGTIPTELGSLTNLTWLVLNGNQLIGPIPTELGSLTNLANLILSNNQLSGEIPAELGRLTNLGELVLWGNQLSGEIPAELGSLTNLGKLDLSGNQLSGEIPAELGNLASLEFLYLAGNPLTGCVPASLRSVASNDFPELGLPFCDMFDPAGVAGDRAALVALYNAADGPNWTNNSGWLTDAPMNQWHGVTTGAADGRVTGLALRVNQLSGEIPVELGNLANLLWLDLSYNQLSGEIPAELGNLASPEFLYLAGNPLTGCVPVSLRSVANNDFTELGLPFCDMLPSGSVAGDRDALAVLYNAADGANWTNNSGWLTDAPMSQWHGVRTNGNGRVTVLSLEYNRLSGEIPAELGSLANLYRLYLSGNQLSGKISSELGNLTNLVRLSLSYNQLSGEIPAELGSLSKLQGLFLSGNQLTGCIPVGIAGVANNDLSQLGLPFCAGALGAPTLGTLTSGADFLTVTWAAPTGSPESAIIAYDLRYIESAARDKSDVNWTVMDNAWTAGSGTLSYQIAGLTNGTRYDVQVRAVTATGGGPWSATAAGTPAAWGAVRSFSPPSVPPAGEVVVMITASGYGGFGGVTETLPPGFSYVSSSLEDDSVTAVGREVRFSLLGQTAFAYTVTASSAAGTYSFSGVLRNSDREDVPVGGALAMAVAAGNPLIVRYDANGNGMIEKSEVINAINDYLSGEGDEAISKSDVIKLINLYLFG